jgi:hypothetical protein
VVVLGKPSQKPNGSIFFKTASAKILSTPPSTTYIKLSQIGEPRLSRIGRGLYGMAHKLNKRYKKYLFDLINMMDLINQFLDHLLIIMNHLYLETCINHKFDNNIHISNPVNKKEQDDQKEY